MNQLRIQQLMIHSQDNGNMVWEMERSYDLSPHFISDFVSTVGRCIIPYVLVLKIN
jgi:hypothetical protein